MNIKNLTLILITMLWISFASCGQKQNSKTSEQETDPTISLISATDLNKVNDQILIVDVRTPEEYDAGHIENAINIDYRSDHFKDLVSELDKKQDVYVYCKVGGRSGRSAQILEELGFEKVYDLEGGIIAWEKEGFKTVK